MDSLKNGKISVELIEATLKNLEIEQSIREQRMPISLIRRVSEEEELIIEPPKIRKPNVKNPVPPPPPKEEEEEKKHDEEDDPVLPRHPSEHLYVVSLEL